MNRVLCLTRVLSGKEKVRFSSAGLALGVLRFVCGFRWQCPDPRTGWPMPFQDAGGFEL